VDFVQVLSTKLSVPPLRSTLLSAWLSQLKLPATWLSLDDGDSEPVRFLTYLGFALDNLSAWCWHRVTMFYRSCKDRFAAPEKISALPWLGIARAWFVGAGMIEQSLQLLDECDPYSW
jgi:hypothetical protein